MDTSTTRVMMMASSRTRYRLASTTPPTRPQAAAQPRFLAVSGDLGADKGPTSLSCGPTRSSNQAVCCVIVARATRNHSRTAA